MPPAAAYPPAGDPSWTAATTLGTGTLDATGNARFSTTAFALASGSHSITASYGGDSHYLVSTSAALTQKVLSAQQQSSLPVEAGKGVIQLTVRAPRSPLLKKAAVHQRWTGL